MKVPMLKEPMYKTQVEYDRSYKRIYHIIARKYYGIITEIGNACIGKRSSLREIKAIFGKGLAEKYPDIPVDLFIIRINKDSKNSLHIDFNPDMLTEFAVTAYNSYGNNKCKVCGKTGCKLRDKHKGCCSRFIPENFQALIDNVKKNHV